VHCEINGRPHDVDVHPMRRLLDVIREDVGLKGTKEGCGEGECGACALVLNGELVFSCLVPAVQAEGGDIQTIEGGDDGALLQHIQDAFLEFGGAQCGICTPGMIMAALALLKTNPTPTLDDVRRGLAGNICRCTGYAKIFDAVLGAAARLKA
jgi:carbon-monoxide dehydrogenase small subunit